MPACQRLRQGKWEAAWVGDEGPWLLVLTQQMASLNLKHGQWWVLGTEWKRIKTNDVGRGKLVGCCEEQDSRGQGRLDRVAGGPRGALCLGNGSEGELPF